MLPQIIKWLKMAAGAALFIAMIAVLVVGFA